MLVLCFIGAMAVNAQDVTIELSENFDELKVYDRLNVEIVKSTENRLVVSGDDTDKVSASVDDGTLKVRMDLGNFMDGNQTTVVIYYNEQLNVIDVNEGAEIMSKEKLSSSYLTLKAQEGGRLTFPLAVKNVQAKAISGGKINVSGTASNTDISIRTGGEYNAKNLETVDCDISVLAGGKADLTASGLVDAAVTAGGTINIYGNPEKVEKDQTLGGSVIVR